MAVDEVVMNDEVMLSLFGKLSCKVWHPCVLNDKIKMSAIGRLTAKKARRLHV